MKAQMGEYIEDMFARADLPQIRNFLLNGVEELKAETRSYHERLVEGSNPIFQRIDDMYLPDMTERDKAAADLSDALTVSENVYMELGMKVGARLIYQLLLTIDKPPTDETEEE